MKQLFIAFLATLLIAACNSNKNPEPGSGLGGPNFNNIKKPEPKNPWGGGGDNPINNPAAGGDVRAQLMTGCLQQLPGDPQAQAKCDCWVGKMVQRYPNAKAATEMDENVANQLAMDCMQQFGGGDDGGYQENPNYPGGDDINVPNNNGGGGGNWTAAQRQQYVQGCMGTSQQGGLTAAQASSYCDCMTRKVEAKYNFEQAARMTAADFQAPEWQQAAYECYPKQQQYEY